MKTFFTFSGITFDTKKVVEGWRAYLNSRRTGKFISLTKIENAFIPEIIADPILRKHADIYRRFINLAQKFDLPDQPQLALSHYNYSVAFKMKENATNINFVVLDCAMLKILEPKELEAIMAHELAHLELGHDGTGDRRIIEHDANKCAAQVTGNPEALISAFNKLEQLRQELGKASLAYRILSTGGNILATINGAIDGRGIHPSIKQTIQKIKEQPLTERVKETKSGQEITER